MTLILTEAQVKALGALPPFDGAAIIEEKGSDIQVTYPKDGTIQIALIDPDGFVFTV